MDIAIGYFSSAKPDDDISSETLHINESTGSLSVLELVKILENKYSRFKATRILRNCAITVNLEYVDDATVTNVVSGDNVAFIPPVSGG